MKKLILLFFVSGLILLSCNVVGQKNQIELKTNSIKISINRKGEISNLIDSRTGTDYLSKDTIAPLMSVRIEHKIVVPRAINLFDNNLILKYPEEIVATIKVEQKDSYITFELLSLANSDKVDLIIWGPYPTTMNKVIGETVGVVQSQDYALGIQALNPKTLGGYPWNENDCMPQIDIFDQADLSDMKEDGKRYVLYRVEAAKPTKSGSSLQAYCRKRDKDRVVDNLDHERYITPAFDDGGYIGSKIALFGCPVDNALETIGKIEIAEGLPHPKINGEWGKTSRAASSAYMIMDFGEDDLDKAIAITKKAGLKYLYHSGPFENWGHFKLDEKQFPHGKEGMKNCVERAKKQCIVLGVHTLSNFITTNDPYVTPIPDKRLAKVGSSVITEEITEMQTEIPVESPDFFDQYKNNNLKTAMIGDELIRYEKVSESKPWRLLDCQRGEFKTKASAHAKNTEISLLTDHGYKVFLTDADLGKEVAGNIADFFNYTGLRQISFDGLEGNRSTGMGNYGEILFTKSWYDKLNDDIKTNYIADASRTNHYFWHIYTRMNWGEPWYAGFRESQTEYRLKNQKYFKRNLMPAMLGWFSMKPETSVEDIEWLLARSAAFNAGYAFVTSYEAIEKNGNSDKILQLIGEWEKVRMAGIFSTNQKKRMEDIANEFTLENVNDHEWNLRQVFSGKFKHEKKERQPGEPKYSAFTFDNKGKEQIANLILTAVDCDVSNITLEKDNHKTIVLTASLKAGDHIKYTGGAKAFVYDKNWQKIAEYEVDSNAFIVSQGKHTIGIDCQFSNAGKEPSLKLEIRTLGEIEKLILP